MEMIDKNRAVQIAILAEREHPYAKDASKPETYSSFNEGWSAACDYILARLEAEKSFFNCAECEK